MLVYREMLAYGETLVYREMLLYQEVLLYREVLVYGELLALVHWGSPLLPHYKLGLEKTEWKQELSEGGHSPAPVPMGFSLQCPPPESQVQTLLSWAFSASTLGHRGTSLGGGPNQ